MCKLHVRSITSLWCYSCRSAVQYYVSWLPDRSPQWVNERCADLPLTLPSHNQYSHAIKIPHDNKRVLFLMATDDVRLRVVRGDHNNNTVLLLFQTYCKLLSLVHSCSVLVLARHNNNSCSVAEFLFSSSFYVYY